MCSELLQVVEDVERALKSAIRTTVGWCEPVDFQVLLEAGCSGGSEIVGEDVPPADILPKGAPRDKTGKVNWSSWEGRARVALDRAHARMSDRHAQGPTFDDEYDFVEDSRDVDDTRWEQPGYALDPYWSTCPAVIEDQAITNSAVRWCEFDGEHAGPEAPMDYLSLDRVTLDTLRQRWADGTDRSHNTYLWGRGLKSLTDISSQNQVDYISRKGADDTAYMRHGGQCREDRFWMLLDLLNRGHDALCAGKPGAVGFLAWLVYLWDKHVESKISAGIKYRKLHADNKTLACGREYYLTYTQAQHLRGRRKRILRQYSHIKGLSREKGQRFITLYARKYLGKDSVSGVGHGTRGGVDFGVNPTPRPKTSETWNLSASALAYIAEKKKRYTYTDGQKREHHTRAVAVAHIIRRGSKAHTA